MLVDTAPTSGKTTLRWRRHLLPLNSSTSTLLMLSTASAWLTKVTKGSERASKGNGLRVQLSSLTERLDDANLKCVAMDKIAIPRLRNTIAVTDANQLGSKARVSRACEPCRNQKTKCSGETPMCRHCHTLKLSCYYADRKRDRAKRYGHPHHHRSILKSLQRFCNPGIQGSNLRGIVEGLDSQGGARGR